MFKKKIKMVKVEYLFDGIYHCDIVTTTALVALSDDIYTEIISVEEA